MKKNSILGLILFISTFRPLFAEWKMQEFGSSGQVLNYLNNPTNHFTYQISAIHNGISGKFRVFSLYKGVSSPKDWKVFSSWSLASVVSFINTAPSNSLKISEPHICGLYSAGGILYYVFYRVVAGSPDQWKTFTTTNVGSVLSHINKTTNTAEQVSVFRANGVPNFTVFSKAAVNDTTQWSLLSSTNFNEIMNGLNGNGDYVNSEVKDLKIESYWNGGTEVGCAFVTGQIKKLFLNRDLYGIKDGILNPLYLGGVTYPCLEVADINGDGRKDIIIGDHNRIECFLNMSNAPMFSTRWIYNSNVFPILNSNLLSVPRLIDIDKDGDLDLFVGKAGSLSNNYMGTIDFYQNTGTKSNAIFNSLPTQTDYAGVQVASYAIPTFVDIDSDGDYDLCVEEEYEPLWLYKNIGTPTSASWSFEGVTPGLDVTDEGAYASFGDLDKDGDLDAVVGNAHGHSKLYKNFGASNQPSFSYVPTDLDPILYQDVHQGPRPVLVNLDNDTDLDFISCHDRSPYFVLNTGTVTSAKWSVLSGDNLYFDWGYYRSGVVCHDFNADGKKDLVAVSPVAVNYYRNQGTVSSPNWMKSDAPFQMVGKQYFDNSSLLVYNGVTSGDIDGDNDQDLYVGIISANQSGAVYFIKNIGTAQNPIFDKPLASLGQVASLNSGITPALVDIDKDGDLDMFLGCQPTFNANSGSIYFIKNIGTPQSASWSLITTNYNNISIPGCAPTFQDIDQDGDYDMFVGSKQGPIWAYRNVGSATNPVWLLWSNNWKKLEMDTFSHPVFTDLNGDGTIDLLSGGEKGGVRYWKGSLNTF